jgi:hypothetical protein
MELTENKIGNNIKRQRRGKLLFANGFVHKSGLIMRVAHDVYYYPKKDMKYGNMPIPPTIDEIAYGIAKRDKIRIVPTGSYALNTLGLSTRHTITIGNHQITFIKCFTKRTQRRHSTHAALGS